MTGHTRPERTYDRPLLDKLGVKPGARVALLGVEDAAFREELALRTGEITEGWPEPDSDVVFLEANDVGRLSDLFELRRRIAPDGAIWIVSRKGKAATLRDIDVIEAAKSAGLVDNKVVSFSRTHTALRLVIPRAERG